MVITHTYRVTLEYVCGALLQTSKKCGLFFYSLESVVHVVTGWVFQQNSWEIMVFVMCMYFFGTTEKLSDL